MKNNSETNALKKHEIIKGTVESVTFHNPESGFCVLRVKVQNQSDLIKVVGTSAEITAGVFVDCEGYWESDPKFGPQFRCVHLKVSPPDTIDGIRKYLSSGMVKGIGPHFASKLVDAFGREVFDVIEKQPEKLLTLEGIGRKRQKQIIKAWSEQKVVQEIMVFLHSHGLGTARAVRIYKTYGDNAIERVKENPYRLAFDIWGIGFKSADQLAQHLGIHPHAPIRAQAGLHQALYEFSNQGHCAVLQTTLIDSAMKLLEIPEPVICEALQHEIQRGALIEDNIDDQAAVYLTKLYEAEMDIAEHIGRLHHHQPPWTAIDAEQAIPWVEGHLKIELSQGQRHAVAGALQQKISVITGGPGVGKTTVVNSILHILGKKINRIACCAPTGRAAKRMEETTQRPAKTIHRLLEFDPQSFGFRHDEDNPLEIDLLVLDEASMVDVILMSQLLRAIPDQAAIIIVGDVDQLPSVGPGSVLGDLIKSECVHCTRLTEIFRQAAQSRIVVNAHRINQGEMPLWEENPGALSDFYFIRAENEQDIQDKLSKVIAERIPQRFDLDPVNDIQVLTPLNRGGLGSRALNGHLQSLLNPGQKQGISRFGVTFSRGDKVIQLVNDYDKEVFNGDIGTLWAIDEEQKTVTVEFDKRPVDYEYSELDELSLAYAITIHKSQGSEYPAVVIPLATQHYTLLERNLLYTAVTRGKRLVVLIGQIKAVSMAVNNQRSRKRVTNLIKRLQQTLAA